MSIQTVRATLLAVVVCAGVLWTGAAPAMASGPAITSFTPASAPIGATVTIRGKGFTGATKVTFSHGAAAEVTVASPRRIIATVPASASRGRITVRTGGGTATSKAKFTVRPSIRLSPATGPPGSTVLVAGAGFGRHEAVDLYFDISDEALASASGTGKFSAIPVALPASALPGTHYITAVGRHSGLSAQVRVTVATDWPQYRYGNKHTALNPFENVLSSSNVGNLDLDWTFTTGNAVDSSPAVVDGTLYVGSTDGNVYALNESTGAKLWSYATGTAVYSSPAVVNGVVYVGSNNGDVYALSAATGAKLWSYDTGGYVFSSPTVASGVVYVGSGGNSVYALSAATGTKLWSYATGNAVESSPAVANNVVYVGSDDDNVYALNASTGAKLWSYATTGAAESSPTVADGVVYIGSNNGELYALNAATGAELWSYLTGGSVEPSPAVAEGVVYVGSITGTVYAVNAATGSELWSYATGSGVGYASPVVANGVVYVGSGNDDLYALDAATGARLWSYLTAGSIYYGSPAVANGVVYVGAGDDNVYAFDLPAGAAAVTRPALSRLHPDYALRPETGNGG
jgi:outer membrane protein assembly factor BamB